MWHVGRELRRQGYPGWRQIASRLSGTTPVRLIQLYVRLFKQRRKLRKKERIVRNRVTVRVLARDVIWGQDGTHVGRMSGESVESQIIRDRGSLAFIGVQTGPVADHEDVLRLFEKTAIQRAGFPLVYARDNGSMYAHEEVQRYMDEHKIVVLRSVPRVSQHNGATERSIRELKDATGLGKGVQVDDQEAHAAMLTAAMGLNKNRVRPSKEFKTAIEMDETLPVGYNCGRDRFYQQCRQNMERAVQGAQTARAARFAEREAVFSTLEEFGLIKRSRGGKPYVQN
jgi:transposase InsO family protein